MTSSCIRCAERIIIGDNVKIGALTIITDSDAHSLDPQKRSNPITDIAKSKQIIICNNVFIGASSIICKGVTIGENSIVGAGSVVTKSIPNNEIWTGNPARYIKTI